MKKIAFLFPGQGSQSTGMGRDAAGMNTRAAGIFDEADATLGFSLSKLCFEGPDDALRPTEITQPALYTASAATLAILREAGIEAAAVAGHSLGEYSALYAAGAFEFATGLKLVRTRGLAMAEAGAAQPGAMAAILGLEGGHVVEICAAASEHGIVVAANFNDPGQTVISGSPAAVDAACAAAKAAGAKRALVLPVSGAFHSPIVAPAGEKMALALSTAEIAAPQILFINNADVDALTLPNAIRDSLVRQITSPVRWVETMTRLAGEGIEAFVEVGSGKVLSGLARRCCKDIPCHTTENAAAIDETLKALA
jgi:[acyl-carrier-protein] S-malonyltransferase